MRIIARDAPYVQAIPRRLMPLTGRRNATVAAIHKSRAMGRTIPPGSIDHA